MPQGPNVKKLIIRRMSMLAVPVGGGFKDAIKWLTSPEKLQQTAREATDWVNAALAAVKSAPNNTFGNDDEAIAGEIIRRIEENEKKRKAKGGF